MTKPSAEYSSLKKNILSIMNNIKLKYKLLGMSVFISTNCIIVLASISFYQSKDGLLNVSKDQLISMREITKQRIQGYFKSVEGLTLRLAKDRLLEDLFIDYKDAFSAGGYDSMRDSLIEKTSYHKLHEEYGERTRTLASTYQLDNIYLVSNDGMVVFSSHPDPKGSILGRSLENGALKESQLTNCFNQASKSKTDMVFFSDYELISSSNKVMGFLCTRKLAEFDHTSKGINKGDVIGIIATSIDMKLITAITSQRDGMGVTGHSYLVGQDKIIRSNLFLNTKKYNLVNVFKQNIHVEASSINSALHGKIGTSIVENLEGEKVLSAFSPITIFNKKWAIISEKNIDEINQPLNKMLQIIILASIIVLFLALLLTAISGLTITMPMKTVIKIFCKMKDDIVSGKLSVRGEKDAVYRELVPVIEGTNDIIDNLLKPIEEALTILQSMAKGDFTTQMLGNYQGDNALLKNALNDSIFSVRSVLNEVNDVAKQIKNCSNQVADANNKFSSAATEQASSLEQISSSVREIESQTKQNSENAVQTQNLSNESKSSANTGNDHMKKLSEAMSDIIDSSQNISKIIKVIDEIAFQTNLLSLNAAVEAARAGKYGKGFAVVAEEVRSLARGSAKAAKETSDLIQDTISKVSRGNEITNKAVASLEEITAGANKVTELVNEITAASKEQATGIKQIGNALEQVNLVTQKSAATAEETNSVASELSNMAEKLYSTMTKFKL
ncbi:MAG: methyl-accepting chemotaxis protein [Bacteriovoracaceae bacterium]|nr:methyl-accepting chemotaxis protein [Bacteriovoracaceae bacterium]